MVNIIKYRLILQDPEVDLSVRMKKNKVYYIVNYLSVILSSKLIEK